MTTRLPTYAISHGGGPWPWMRDLMPVDMEPLWTALSDIPSQLPAAPRAVLVVTAHWETSGFEVQANPTPPMIYDYGGFPPHTYDIEYPAPGDPALAGRVVDLLSGAGLPITSNPTRGFDHGTFVPLFVMYPEADVPVVQLSIDRSYDPASHLAVGRALAPLRDEGVLIVSSGVPTWHSHGALQPMSQEPSQQFDRWLTETIVECTGTERCERLRNWASAPAARLAHAREDHFIPLLVAAAAGGDDGGTRHYHEPAIAGFTAMSGYRIG